MNKKKIILVANTTWNIYNFRLNVIRKLLSEGHQLMVIAPVDEYLEYKEKYPQVKHIPLKSMNRDSKNPIKDLVLTIELWRKYKRHKPDLIIHYTNKPNIYGGIAAKLLGLKSVAVVTGLGYSFIHGGTLSSVVNQLYKFTGKFHNRFIFENEDDRKLFIESQIVNESKAHSVKGCGVDTSHFLPSPNGVHREKITFTFVGRLLYDKGITEFIAAAKEIKQDFSEAQFEVIGEFDSDNPSNIDKESLVQWVDSGVIDYKGFVRDIRPFLSQSDCIVLPSYREGMPRTILEGMSMGKPVITTDVPGCRETVIDGKNGYVVPVRDKVALKNAMINLINLSPEERTDMGIKGRSLAVNVFDDKLIAKEILNIIQPLIDEPSN